MNSTLEYIANLHPTLAKDYRTPDGRYREHCAIIAVNIAKRLLFEGKIPHIKQIMGKKFDGWNSLTLFPKPFGGRISWGGHLICCVDDLVYDPMIGSKPADISEYLQLAFFDDVETKIAVSKEEIREFVLR